MKYSIYRIKNRGKACDQLYMYPNPNNINRAYAKMSQFNREDKDIDCEYEVRAIEE